MTTQDVGVTRISHPSDDTAVRVVRALLAWHDLQMPDLAAVLGQSIGTVERRLSRRPENRKSWLAWELGVLASAFGVPVTVFYSGEVDLAVSRRPTTDRNFGDSAWADYLPSRLTLAA